MGRHASSGLGGLLLGEVGLGEIAFAAGPCQLHCSVHLYMFVLSNMFCLPLYQHKLDFGQAANPPPRFANTMLA